ncbi:MAG TPA: CARDB domain-containing protein [Thermoflexus sp.]|nr:CARDB domain-containing protein [Thermoflexus sp.]
MRPIHRIVFRTGLSLGIAGVLLALWLVGAALWFASPPPPPARAQGMGQITHTTVADFTAPCVISMNISVANTDGGELRLVASVEDYFDGTSLDTTRWITNISNPQAGSYQSLIMGSGLITLDGVYLRSVLTMTQVPMFFETRARLMQSANTSGSPDLGFYREIGPLYNPNTMSSSIRLFILGNGDPNDLIVRARDDGGEMIDRNIPDPDKTQFHIFRIEWEEGQTRYLIDGQPQETITINTTVITSWVFLYHQTPSFYGSTPTDIDWVRAGQYALNGIFTSCPQDAGQKVQWTTLSWDADTPAGTTVTFRVRTSMDGTTWSDWSNPLPSNPNNIPPSLAFARYLQYRVEMSTTSPMFSPEVRQIVLRSTELADLTVSKEASASTVLAGTELTYTVRVTNNGPLNATNVRVTDTLPAGVTLSDVSTSQGSCSGPVCDLGTLNAGATALLTLRVRVNSNTPAGQLTNTVVASTSNPDDPANNTASITTQVQTQADLALTISDSPDPVIAGTPLTYTVLVTNNGPSDARNVQLTVTIPSEVVLVDFSPSACSPSGNQIRCDREELSANNAFTLNITVIVSPEVPAGTLLIAQADVSSDVADPDVEDNTTIASTEVTLEADLQAYLVGDPNLVFVGEVITYTLTLTNTGPSTASRVTATLSIPSGLSVIDVQPSQGSCTGTECDLGSLAVEGSATVRWWVRVMQWPGSLISVRATVQSEAEDPNPEDNSPAISTAVRLRVFLPLVYR